MNTTIYNTKITKVTICGGGRGGFAMAADLTLAGHEVTLFQLPEFAESLKPVEEQGGIIVSGNTSSGKTGLAKPKLITTNASKAFDEAEIVMIAVPGNGHETMFRTIAPYVQDNQIIVVNTGYWASLRFQSLFEKLGKKVTIAETNLLVYLAAMKKPGEVYINATKDTVSIAAFPATENERVLQVVQQLYPQFTTVSNAIEVNLNNLNAFMHSPIVFMNFGVIERLKKEPFHFYRDGATESVCTLIEEMDKERLEIANKFNINVPDVLQSEINMYGHVGANGNSIYEIKKNNRSAQEFALESADASLGMLDEDIPYSLIPLISIGEQLGTNVEIMRSFATLLMIAQRNNYNEEAINVDDLGISGLKADQINEFVTTGEKNILSS